MPALRRDVKRKHPPFCLPNQGKSSLWEVRVIRINAFHMKSFISNGTSFCGMNRSHQSPNFYHQFQISYLAAFERMTRLNENVLVDRAVQCHLICTLGRLPDSFWRRPPCRPRSRWIEHLQIREGALSDVVLDYDLMSPSIEYCISINTLCHYSRSWRGRLPCWIFKISVYLEHYMTSSRNVARTSMWPFHFWKSKMATTVFFTSREWPEMPCFNRIWSAQK